MLDEIDQLIVYELQNDARLSYAELGRRVHLSPPAVTERVQRLIEQGIIKSYQADINPESLGWNVVALIQLEVEGRYKSLIPDIAQKIPEVIEFHRVTGEKCFILKVVAQSMTHLSEINAQFAPYAQITTNIQMEAWRRAIPLPT